MKDGQTVRRSIEELRVNFDMDKVVEHFLSGKLVEWLEDRFYEEEADKIREIDKDAPERNRLLCEALGVEYRDDMESELDADQLMRLNEKKQILREKTDDNAIIANAAQTALTQEDLADLLDLDTAKIYLCGEKFTVPVRVPNKSYIGILGTPKISIKAASDAELAAKNISFENVILPWTAVKKSDVVSPVVESEKKSSSADDELKNQLREIFEMSFGFNPGNVWYGNDNKGLSDLSPVKKKVILGNICGGEYTEGDLIFIKVSKDFLKGWALTKESICINTDKDDEPKIIKWYDDIDEVGNWGRTLEIDSSRVEIDDDFLSGMDIIGIVKYLKHVKAILPNS